MSRLGDCWNNFSVRTRPRCWAFGSSDHFCRSNCVLLDTDQTVISLSLFHSLSVCLPVCLSLGPLLVATVISSKVVWMCPDSMQCNAVEHHKLSSNKVHWYDTLMLHLHRYYGVNCKCIVAFEGVHPLLQTWMFFLCNITLPQTDFLPALM